MVQPVYVFYSYASADKADLLKLEKYLRPLEGLQKISAWHRGKLRAGDNAEQEIEARLSQAEVIILLVSSNFLDPDEHSRFEIERALQLYQEQQVPVVPVILKDCLWNETPFSKLAPLPQEGKPISAWLRKDAAWQNVAIGLLSFVDELQKQRRTVPEMKTSGSKKISRTRTLATAKPRPAKGAITEASIPDRVTRPASKDRILKPSRPVYTEREPALTEEPVPATPEARQATPDFGQHYNPLQNKINAVQLNILIWEPETPVDGLVADHRRKISQELENEQHRCWLGRTLEVPKGASLQETELEQARQSDTTILLFEPPAHTEMAAFCTDEKVVEKTLVFYPKTLQSQSEHWNLERRLHIRYHLKYYDEQDIILEHVLTDVQDWVLAQRSFRYSNPA